MIANDVRVLVDQLNKVVRNAAQNRMRIEIAVRGVLDVDALSSYDQLTVHVWTEVH